MGSTWHYSSGEGKGDKLQQYPSTWKSGFPTLPAPDLRAKPAQQALGNDEQSAVSRLPRLRSFRSGKAVLLPLVHLYWQCTDLAGPESKEGVKGLLQGVLLEASDSGFPSEHLALR